MRPKRIRYPNGRYVHYAYPTALDESLGRVAAIQDDNGGSPGTTVASYQYDGAGRIVVEDYKDAKVRLDLVDLAGWAANKKYAGFDRFGRVKQQWWHDYDGGGADVVKHTHGYDRNSNRRWKADAVATAAGKKLDELYAYGNLNRLVGFKRGKLTAGEIPTTDHDRLRGVQWGLSDTGNWTDYQVDADGEGGYPDGDYADAGDLDQDRTHNKANEIWNSTPDDAITEEEGQVAWARPGRNAQGNMTTATKPSSPTGTYTCKYDAWNRLMYLVCEDTYVLYRYDGLHRQICKLVAVTGNTFDRTDYYHTAGWQVVEERLAEDVSDWDALYNPNPTAATEPKYQYVWSLRYIDAAVLRDENTDPETDDLCDDDRLYYCNDVNMNVMALVDDSGTVQERYVYNAYGEVTIYNPTWSETVDWADGEHNEILYCGYRWDHKSGLYHVRFRMYHPTLGRWLQRDPLGYVDGMSLYEYARSVPVAYIDALGLTVHIGQIMSPDDALDKLREYEQGLKKDDYEFSANASTLKGLGWKTFFPGTAGTGDNAFVFTCRFGWLDIGHFFMSAYEAYKAGQRSRSGTSWAVVLEAYKKGLAVERLQDLLRITSGRLTKDMANSAWTPEDLPSDFAGASFGALLVGLDSLLRAGIVYDPQIGTFRPHPIPKPGELELTNIADAFADFLSNAQVVNPVGNAMELLKQDAASWVDSTGWVLRDVRTAGKSIAMSVAWQKQRLPFTCFCNPDGTVKEAFKWKAKGLSAQAGQSE